jgi:hypothetical protein
LRRRDDPASAKDVLGNFVRARVSEMMQHLAVLVRELDAV